MKNVPGPSLHEAKLRWVSSLGGLPDAAKASTVTGVGVTPLTVTSYLPADVRTLTVTVYHLFISRPAATIVFCAQSDFPGLAKRFIFPAAAFSNPKNTKRSMPVELGPAFLSFELPTIKNAE